MSRMLGAIKPFIINAKFMEKLHPRFGTPWFQKKLKLVDISMIKKQALLQLLALCDAIKNKAERGTF